MDELSDQEKIIIIISIILTLIGLFQLFFFPNQDYSINWLIFGVTATISSFILIYYFVIKQSQPRKKSYPIHRSRMSDRRSFTNLEVIPPSKLQKKTKIEGKCYYCNSFASFGFTCSFCGGYFCSDHRIPEKHHCVGLRR
ncbi:AN1-type zinc finger domain-containing protein [Candidatus Hodarchaeum mangrovi]